MKARMIFLAPALVASCVLAQQRAFAQDYALQPRTASAATAPTAVPALIPYSGVALGADGGSLAGEVAVTFLIFKDEQGGEPLFTETQTAALDSAGRYKIQLGATYSSGIPLDLFSTGEARWLEVQIAGQPAHPRILLASVPYALKAADAATLGGLPASAFALAGQRAKPAVTPDGIKPDLSSNVTTSGGTSGYVPVFDSATDVTDSPIFISGANVGIGTATPTAQLTVSGNTVLNGAMTVNGDSTYNGSLVLPAPGTATTTKSYSSNFFKLQTSAWNSASNSAVSPRFQWQALVTGNNTATPGVTLDLYSSTGTAAPTQTGFYFNSNGTINFAPGQTFPGTGPGTITGVTAGTALTGGGTTGTVTLKLDTTKVPLLAAANNFTGNQNVTGSLTTSGALTASNLFLPGTTGAPIGTVRIGPATFLSAFGPAGSFNTFVGGAGNFTTSGSFEVGVGSNALNALTSGSDNTATGYHAAQSLTTGAANTAYGTGTLASATTGSSNTAVGYVAGDLITTGTDNTALGEFALNQVTTGFGNTALGYEANTTASVNNSTAVGYYASVSQSNSLVLGQTYSGSPGKEFVNVGIGTDVPRSILETTVASAGALGPVVTLTNQGIGGGTAAALDFNTYTPSNTGTYNPTARIEAIDDGSYSSDLYFNSNVPGAANHGFNQNMIIDSNGQVGIGINPAVGNGGTYIEFMQMAVLGTTNSRGGVYAATGSGDLPAGVFDGTGATAGSAPGEGILVEAGGDNAGAFITGGSVNSAGQAGDGIDVEAGLSFGGGVNGLAANFVGDIAVTGKITAGTKDFKIDHPLDPANKYLVHSSVESSEMMNIYTGNVTTDDLGMATVKLPDWFQSENGDFRYQLTVIGGRFAQAILSREIENNQFTISTNATNVKVSWQVTAVRQDAFAKANPLVVEQEKPAREKGFYLHPELYGQPPDKQTEWGRNPQQMQHMKAMREARSTETKSVSLTGAHTRVDPPASAVNRPVVAAVAPVKKAGGPAKP